VAGKIKQIWDAIAACFEANREPLTKAQVLAWIGSTYRDNNFNPNTVQAQLYRSCVNVASPQLYKTPKILFYDKVTRTYVRNDDVYVPDNESVLAPSNGRIVDSDESELQSDSTFALESHLRDYLARNLFTLEKGLELWSITPPSVEYGIDGRRIDILAKDTEGTPVVIELKLNKGYDKVVGQALLYQGLMGTRLSVSRVRIILVAGEVSDELKIACGRLTDVALFEYAITMETKRVSSSLSEDL
jgi:hypothetical protein